MPPRTLRLSTVLFVLTIASTSCGNSEAELRGEAAHHDGAAHDAANHTAQRHPAHHPALQDSLQDSLRAALTFHASFDGATEAAYANGDPIIYTAPSWSRRTEGTAGLPGDTLVTLATAAGLHGDALEFVTASPGIVYFRAKDNIAYRDQDWSGTISFWLSLDPDEDLEPGYVDPLQISPRSWDDAALFVDFTRDDTPRHFRFAAFADRDVWNPEGRDWSEIAFEDRPMVEVPDPLPFDGDGWTHVVMTFEGFNTGEANGVVTTYLNAGPQGTLSGREQTFTWDLDETIIAIGLDYVGLFDELSLFDRALEPAEVAALYDLEGGMSSIL